MFASIWYIEQEDHSLFWYSAVLYSDHVPYFIVIIEAHPNWPVYADVFKHPPPWLASRRPIWSNTTSVNTIM